MRSMGVEQVRQFEERHPVGTKARLALALLLFLGVRRGDLVVIGAHTCATACSASFPGRPATGASGFPTA